ncbi:MAG: radical SAM family heme chaperone HemW [Bacteroidaceae bacterium]|nr:radical SAM family heme chaperone HemW [Bacteroidaceae bacterium]
MAQALYIHIPFCKTRCAYCSFYSTTSYNLMDRYVSALCHEMSLREHFDISTVYIGGGTPSQLGEERLSQLLSAVRKHFHVKDEAEITVEVNPDDITTQLTEILYHNGVNRVSMGVQSFDETELRSINRRHTAQQAVYAVQMIKAAGISNISIDLMYGLPGQTLQTFANSVNKAIGLPVTHISSYALSIEEGTLLHRQLQAGLISETDEEITIAMYNLLRHRLQEAGFEHYEISNFARPGYSSRHNSSYWDGTPYIGLGPGAHGYDGHCTRRQNTPNLQSYINAKGDVPHTHEHLSEDERYDELIFTRLRTAKGLQLSLVSDDRRKYLLHMAEPHLAAGRLTLAEGETVLRLTDKGLFVSDDIFADLMAE